MSSNVPLAREYLTESCALFHKAIRLQRKALGLMTRAKYVRKAPKQSTKMTKTLANKIIKFTDAHPRMTEQKIAEHFGIGSGRVSEALNGKWR